MNFLYMACWVKSAARESEETGLAVGRRTSRVEREVLRASGPGAAAVGDDVNDERVVLDGGAEEDGGLDGA